LRTAQLLVNGDLKDTTELTPGTERIAFTADLSDIAAVGANPVEIEVKVTDALGLEGAAKVEVTVQVTAPPTPTPAPTPTSTPTPSLFSGTTFGVVLGGLVCGGVVILIALAGAVFFFLRRRPAPAPPLAAPAPPQETVIVGHRETILATLTILEGPPDRLNVPIPLTKPVSILGRNPEAADVTFFANEESSVSRAHCAIQQEADKTFRLVDKGSTSGTTLNGKPAPPNAPTSLADGDEIVMGELSRRGVRLRFNLVKRPDADEVPSDRTRIVRRSEQPPDK
jgi:pSer/pThr/pTyr-binding forkhead associated (FHA) protein